MCLEITYSAIAKYRETFFGALKTAKNEKPYVFQEIDIPEINMCLFGNFQNLYHFKLDALPSHKTSSGWQMELSLEKVA